MNDSNKSVFGFSVASLNVRGLHNHSKRSTIYSWLNDKQLDIVCLQETYCTEKNIKSFEKDWSGDVFQCVTDSPHSRGVTILLNSSFDHVFVNKFSSSDGRRLMINIKVNNNNFTIVNLYAPNKSEYKKDFLKRSEKWINQHAQIESQIIICGDFNVTIEPKDRRNKKIDPFAKSLKTFMQCTNTVDTFRYLNQEKREYTYFNKGKPESDSRIDYVLVSKLSATMVDSVSIKKVPLVPDHKVVITKLLCDSSKGPGYWKLNTKLLENDMYKLGIENVVKKTIDEYELKVCYRDLWDFCKIRIKEFSIHFSIKLQKERRNNVLVIEKQIADLEEQVSLCDNATLKSEINKLLSELECEYERLYVDKAKGAQIRSKGKYVEEGERSTSYFLNLEKKHQLYNHINSLKTHDGKRVKDSKDILSESVIFYKDLYSADHLSEKGINNYINQFDVPLLSDVEKSLCEGLVTNNECLDVIKQMSSNKSPGYDGLPSDFYKHMWSIVGPIILKSYEEAFINGELSTSHRQSILSLIFKKGDREELKNYRPISLSNYDYKILAFVLSNRLQKVICKLVSPEQTAYIKKRFIGENIRLLLDTIEYINLKELPGILLFLDFKKAYDSLSWNFMFKSLEKYGFGQDFIKWIHILYNKPECMVKVNGYISEEFELKRGIRQGCPISALLFILCTEFLNKHIKSCKLYKGIDICTNEGVKELRISQYADDTTLFVKNPENIVNALDCVNVFSKWSGLMLNYNKTEGLGIGSHKGTTFESYGISWPTEAIRYLGIYISHDRSIMYKQNWENKLEILQKLLDSWRTRSLTLFGKITIVKSLGISQLLFSATMLEIPEGITKKINKIIYNFIWNSKDRIKRKTLIGDYEKGGLRMIDVESQFEAIKAAWVPRITNSGNINWAILARHYLNAFGNDFFVLKMSFQDHKSFEDINQITNFYKEVITGFNKSKITLRADNMGALLNETIWGNRHLTYKGKTLFDKMWIDCEIIKLKDVCTCNGKIDYNLFYNQLQDKRNYFKIATMISKALSQYKSLFINIDQLNNDVNDTTEIDIYECKKSKYFYEKLCSQKFEPPYQEQKWKKTFPVQTINWKKVYILNFKSLTDKKLSEFSYKIIMNLLVCESNLLLWKKSDSNECLYCKDIHTVQHMLYECKHANELWKILSNITRTNINFASIVVGNDNIQFNTAILAIAYAIYKKWLIDKEGNGQMHILQFVKKELGYKITIYKQLKNDKCFTYLYEIYDKLIECT